MTPREESTTVRAGVHGPGTAPRAKVVLYNPHGALAAALDHALCLGITVLTGAPIRDALNASRLAKRLRIERFKYFQQVAWDRAPLWRRPLQQVARWRCAGNRYSLPLEMWIDRALWPAPRLS